MDADWRPVQGSNPPDGGSSCWRAQLTPEARTRIVNKIKESLKKRHPLPDHMLQSAAVLFEEKIYTIATNQDDLDDHVDGTNSCVQELNVDAKTLLFSMLLLHVPPAIYSDSCGHCLAFMKYL